VLLLLLRIPTSFFIVSHPASSMRSLYSYHQVNSRRRSSAQSRINQQPPPSPSAAAPVAGKRASTTDNLQPPPGPRDVAPSPHTKDMSKPRPSTRASTGNISFAAANKPPLNPPTKSPGYRGRSGSDHQLGTMDDASFATGVTGATAKAIKETVISYTGVRLGEIMGKLLISSEKLTFRPIDKADKEHHYGWAWDSLKKHQISAAPTEEDLMSPWGDPCLLKIVSYANPTKAVTMKFLNREDLERAHLDISSRMQPLRKYRKVKEALMDCKSDLKLANRTIDDMQDQNQKLLQSCEAFAKKAKQLSDKLKEQEHTAASRSLEQDKVAELERKLSKTKKQVERMQTEKTAMEIEHEMDQQDLQQKVFGLERELEEVQAENERLQRSHQPIEELELEIKVLAKELRKVKIQNAKLTDQLEQQEIDSEARLWEVRRQRNNVMLELSFVRSERDRLLEDMKQMQQQQDDVAEFKAMEQDILDIHDDDEFDHDEEKQNIKEDKIGKANGDDEEKGTGEQGLAPYKLSLNQSALYGPIFQELFNSNNHYSTVDLRRYYEGMFQMASRATSNMAQLEDSTMAALRIGSPQSQYLSRWREKGGMEPFHSKTDLPDSNQYYFAKNQVSEEAITDIAASKTSSYSILGYCTIDCHLMGSTTRTDKNLSMSVVQSSSSSIPTPQPLGQEQRSTMQCLLPDNTPVGVQSSNLNDNNEGTLPPLTTTTTMVDFKIRDTCLCANEASTAPAYSSAANNFCVPFSTHETVAIWTEAAAAGTA
jgi:hypothetical protein